MMLANEELRTVLVSIHVSLREAIEAVTLDNVLRTLHITHAALRPLLGRTPRMAVAGLNPHAGEGGLFGREEIEIIVPAVARAREAGLDADGPHAPDTVFMRARRGEFDVVVAMYHDQGLIPVKYLGVEKGLMSPWVCPGAYQSGPWHRFRHCGDGAGRCLQPDRGGAHGPPACCRAGGGGSSRLEFRVDRPACAWA